MIEPAPKKYPDELRERGVSLALESQRPIDRRLHEALGEVPPGKFEPEHALAPLGDHPTTVQSTK